jgi:hypothetical protein
MRKNTVRWLKSSSSEQGAFAECEEEKFDDTIWI